MCVRALWKLSSPVESASCITRASHPKTQDTFPWKDVASPLGRPGAGGRVVGPTSAERSTLIPDSQSSPGFGEGGGHRPQTLSAHWLRGGHLGQTKQMGGIWSLNSSKL